MKKDELRILKRHGLYYIEYKTFEYDYGFIMLLVNIIRSFWDIQALKPKEVWYRYDNYKSHTTLQSAKDRLKELLEPDEIIYP